MKYVIYFSLTIACFLPHSSRSMDEPTRLISVTKHRHTASPVIMNQELGKELSRFLNAIKTEFTKRIPPSLTESELQKIRRMIQQNADVNYMPDYLSNNSLYVAIDLGNIEIFKLILDKLTNINIAQKALIHSLVENQFEMAELIVSKFEINQLDKLPHDEFYYLVSQYLMLIGSGPTRAVKDKAENKKAIQARQDLEKSSVEGIKFFIKHKLNSLINEARNGGTEKTPLMYAAESGLLGVVQLLTNPFITEAEIKQMSKEKTSFLHLPPIEILNFTLQYGKPLADITKKNIEGKTALDLARSAYRPKYGGPYQEYLKKTIEYLEILKTRQAKK